MERTDKPQHPLSTMNGILTAAEALIGDHYATNQAGAHLYDVISPYIDEHGYARFPSGKNAAARYATVAQACRSAADDLKAAKFFYTWDPLHDPRLGDRRHAAYKDRWKCYTNLRRYADALEAAALTPDRWTRSDWANPQPDSI